MSFPDRIERTIELSHPPQRVWDAVTTADGLASWFGDWAEVDLRVGGEVRMRWDAEDMRATFDIKVVEPPHRFGFTWRINGLPESDPRRTYVEFRLEPAGSGTLLTVVESGFAQLTEDQYVKAYQGNTEGWTHELAELVAYLDAGA